jgi:hypothetical protein
LNTFIPRKPHGQKALPRSPFQMPKEEIGLPALIDLSPPKATLDGAYAT